MIDLKKFEKTNYNISVETFKNIEIEYLVTELKEFHA